MLFQVTPLDLKAKLLLLSTHGVGGVGGVSGLTSHKEALPCDGTVAQESNIRF